MLMEPERRDCLRTWAGGGEGEETRKVKKLLHFINLYKVWKMLYIVGRKVNLLMLALVTFGSWCLK